MVRLRLRVSKYSFLFSVFVLKFWECVLNSGAPWTSDFTVVTAKSEDFLIEAISLSLVSLWWFLRNKVRCSFPTGFQSVLLAYVGRLSRWIEWYVFDLWTRHDARFHWHPTWLFTAESDDVKILATLNSSRLRESTVDEWTEWFVRWVLLVCNIKYN